MSDQPATVTLTEHEYQEIVNKLEEMVVDQVQQKKYQMMVFTKPFWDNFFTKALAALVSVKNWTLFGIVYMPYELLKLKLITSDNYVNIIVVVAPIVIGLREFSKKLVDINSNQESDPSSNADQQYSTEASSSMLKAIRQKFSI